MPFPIKNNTAENPTYSFAGSPHMGMFPAGEEILGFSTNGLPRVLVYPNGNVRFFGEDHSAPNQTGTGADSFVTFGLGDDRYTVNAGTYTLPVIAALAGTGVSIASGEYVFPSDSDGTAPYRRFSIPSGNYAMTDGAINFVLANYNNGSPILQVATTNSTVNNQTIYPVFVVTRNGSQLDIINLDHESKGLANKLAFRFARTRRIEAEQGGLILGTSPTRRVTLTAGTVWFSATHNALAAFNSTTNDIEFYYHVAGVWTSSIVNQFNNTQYDDGTDLVTLTNNRYAVCFIYRAIAGNTNKCYMVMGQGDYALGAAQTATPPTSLPVEVINTIFVGRIIVEKGVDTPTQVDSPFITALSFAGVTDHESLSNLQGGGANDHKHLTSSELTYLQSLVTGGGGGGGGSGNFITSNTSGISGADVVSNIVSLSTVEYAALVLASGTSPSTIYFVVE